ncbi:hypothetical protein AB4084_15040, partial [Lysobacter sp. 2RAB21]
LALDPGAGRRHRCRHPILEAGDRLAHHRPGRKSRVLMSSGVIAAPSLRPNPDHAQGNVVASQSETHE